MQYDVIIIGGSYAGLSAAMQLGRARRSVLVLDAGERRNRFAQHSHGFLTRDGTDAAEIAAIGRAQVMRYPTVTFRDAQVTAAHVGPPITVTLASGETLATARLILATGVRDELPDIEGLAERWGKHVFHCPYCHGYELDQGPIGVLATSPMSSHHGLMLPDWGPTTYFTRGLFEPDADTLASFARRGTAIDRTPVTRISGAADVELADGRTLSFAGLFVASMLRQGPLTAQLGLAVEELPFGALIKTDAMKATSVPGIFAAGDNAAMGNVAFAVADGARAAVSAHASLIFAAH